MSEVKKPKKAKPETKAPEVETTPEQFETETIIPQALADERAMQASYKDEMLEEEKHRPTNAEIRAWRNDPPEPGVVDVAVAPKGPDVVRRGFTTLQMAVAFRNSLENRGDYLVVEVRDGFGMNGPILCHYVIHKAEEL